MSEIRTLADGIQEELKRNRELLVEYKLIGPSGTFGAAIIEQKIANTDRAMLEGDIVSMLRCHEELKLSE